MTDLKFRRTDITESTVGYQEAVQDRDVELAIHWLYELQKAWRMLQESERIASGEIRPGDPMLEGFLAADIDALCKAHMDRIVEADVKTLEDLKALPKPPK